VGYCRRSLRHPAISDVSVGIERPLNSVDADVVAQVVRIWLDDSLEGWPEGSDRHARVT
jgi:hypothetical protein